MTERWGVDRVMRMAPDSSSEVAGRKLASPGRWSEVGSTETMVWGECRGSSAKPYRVQVELEGPKYKCSCPSRKFPCKHVLGLLFLWAEHRLPTDSGSDDDGSGAPAWVESRATGGGKPSAQEKAPEDPAVLEERRRQQRARAAQRDERVELGMVELRTWLADRVRSGVARLAGRTAEFEQVAARMVDAQAPGVASWLRGLPAVTVSGPGWPERLLGEFALLDLLAQSFCARDFLDPQLRETVRSHLGFTTARAEVLANPGVRDRWIVIGLHDVDDDERVSTRRVWLRGRETGRFALVLFFSVNGAAYEMTMAPGMELDAVLHFHPGRVPLRAQLGEQLAERPQAEQWGLAGSSGTEARAQWVEALAADPWLRQLPIALRGSLRVLRAERRGAPRFAIVDTEGVAIRVRGPESLLWQAMARSGGAELTWLAELSDEGAQPLSMLDADVTGGRLVLV